ncbi:DnaJ domain-containing protein [Artemisia annua]|uniref:DnaJ domain-containing protein n=1 Tax=Artemisia annua TaxID=35608 RepID=A0A2U1KLI9_ARTAN|nr:DnaJ domain-containing protein [Artemisia annua]
MECNKDEAVRAKTIAEKKLSDKDYAGAKKFILKAQTLYPPLDGISQMLTTLDVYIASENKISGEADWYGILGANPNDDDETIRKHYRKLALMLHPDKNKSVGADGAFKLLSEAWSLLSDKAKRTAYNQKRNVRGFQQKVQSQSGGPSAAPPGANGVHFAHRTTSKSRAHPTTATRTSMPPAPRPPAPGPPPPPAVSKRNDTFWTICHRCKMHYEYLKLYLNHTLLCPNCHEPFMAKEMAPPSNLPKSTQSNAQRPQNSKNYATHNTVHRSNVTNKTEPSIAAKAASVVQQVNERLKREREEFYSGWPSKKSKADEESQASGVKLPYQMSTANGGASMRIPHTFSNYKNSVNRTRELNYLETRHILMKKARDEILRKLSEWNSEEKPVEEEEEVKSTPNNNKTANDQEDKEEEEEEDPSMNVPDPDFHDFDLDRTENSFEDNQVWAAYDDDDGMPRFYAMIHKVLSRKPLKMKISWLNSKSTAEFGSFDWLGYGFRKTCGEFRIGRHELYKHLNSFSQKVEWKKTPRGSVHILPSKGQVWALYRNWSRDWNESVPEDVIHKYDMVEVLEDYNEEQGVRVSPLVKFAGFRTVFHPHTHKNEVMVIPKEEMFRFSHQVPKYVLTGSEGHNSPKGCLELDPAATPLDLILQAAETNETSKDDDAMKKGNADKIKNGKDKCS